MIDTKNDIAMRILVGLIIFVLFVLVLIIISRLSNTQRNKKWEISYFPMNVIVKFNLSITPNTPIFISTNNVNHIKEKHPIDYELFFDKLDLVIKNPQNVIEYQDKTVAFIHYFVAEDSYVKVVVRPTSNNIYFLRTLYKLDYY